MHQWKYFLTFLILAVLINAGPDLFAQNGNHPRESLDSMLRRQKGIIGQLAKNLVTDTLKEDVTGPLRNDLPFQLYKDRVIRKIEIQTLEFGVSIADPSKRTTDKVKRLANKIHRDSREYVIRNNLFFSEREN